MDTNTAPPAGSAPGGAPVRNPFLTTNGPVAADPINTDAAAVPMNGQAAHRFSLAAEQARAPVAAAPGRSRRLGRRRLSPGEPTTAALVPAAAVPRERGRTRAVKSGRAGVAKLRPSLRSPRPDVFTAPAAIRGMHTRRVGKDSAAVGWFLLAAHGGCGAGLLQQLCSPAAEQSPTPDVSGTLGVDVGQLWPNPRLEVTGAVVVVARSTVPGLAKARDLAAQYLAGAAPAGTTLLGVVVVADQPGKPPAAVTKSVKLLDGVFARTWQVPYVPEYRLLGPDDPPPLHPLIADVLTDMRTAAATHVPTEGPST